MFIISNIKEKTKNVQSKLTKLNDSEPLSKLSLILILFLDLFVLINLFSGLDRQTKNLVTPNEYVPQICRDIIIEESWIVENRIDKLSNFILRKHRSYYFEVVTKQETHPLCEDIINQLKKLEEDETLVILLRKRDQINLKYNSYDNYTKNLQTQDVQNIISEKNELEDKINKLESVTTFWKIIDKAVESRKQLITDFRWHNFTFPIKKLLLELLFLIPIFIAFYLWNTISLKKERSFQVLVSSHLLVIVIIPIFIKIVDTVIKIIPQKLLQKLFLFLESIHLISIWYYFLIFVSILVTIIFVYIFQKKFFSKQKLVKRRLIKNQCIDCGKAIKIHDKFCIHCGTEQFTNCIECGKQTYIGGKYCANCGKSL